MEILITVVLAAVGILGWVKALHPKRETVQCQTQKKFIREEMKIF